ncbi:DUF1642 domain-containing protein [Listeria innocua]|uniref:DUF1642 domain-containing protein n=1 Tax=Listeria innocua TaxID=1642 RepID=UPI001365E241|nr:DUF1642 domain-containing protein [Listeria innocua]EKE9664820.1 DUF1642 domain-containing protein [Listeria innocua]EKM1326163.1 DUF1642 domain-containing protein [Listeria innocua]EKM1461029.1 DUF1642 domain-containing protein [Listeria innocua]MWW83630.1 DUF1642 domain-containing protein [Listeria innocua]
MKFREGDRVELILRSKKRVGTVEEVYNDTQKCKVQIDGFPVTVTKPQKYLVKVEGSELVVVPQFVADWISHRRQEGYNLIWSISYENNDMPDEVYEWLTSTADNQELFARAWLDGYEVEKEPLYYVKLPISKRNEATDELEVINMCLLLNIRSRETCISGNYRWVDKIKRTDWRTKLTEAEIKGMPGGDIYWQFAVLVEEADGEDNE